MHRLAEAPAKAIETILMCPPRHYRIDYAINPYMTGNVGRIDPALAVDEWDRLASLLTRLGARIEVVTPLQSAPDQVFMSDPGVTIGNTFYCGRFKYSERQAEIETVKDWMTSHDFEVRQLPEGLVWEGNGELLVGLDGQGAADGVLFGGYGIRSQMEAYEWLREATGFEILTIQLTDPRCFHLDVCFTVLPGGYFLIYSEGMAPSDVAKIRDRAPADRIYDADEEDLALFGLNAVIVRRNVVVHNMSERMARWLRDRDFTPCLCLIDQFVRGGGSAKCLTQKLHRLPACVQPA